jgi:diguanylate cyclase (GGDEF)-like protein
MIDIDHFKQINDQMGHLAGDYALREITTCLRDAVRKEELLARYGGEEFALVLPETPLDGALHMAERLREIVANHSFCFEEKPFSLTISLGVISTEGDANLTPTEMIGLADEKLYQAKNDGRNRVVG